MCSEAANAAQAGNASRSVSLLLPKKHEVFYPLVLYSNYTISEAHGFSATITSFHFLPTASSKLQVARVPCRDLNVS
jgi:hypothetical protein